MNTLLAPGTTHVQDVVRRDFARLVDRYADEFASFGGVKDSKACHIAYAMVQDLVAYGLPEEHADFHALMKVLSMLIEAKYSLLDARDEDLDDPMTRLSPLVITGYEAPQRRWLVALNVRQLVNWHEKGYGDFTHDIAEMRADIEDSFTPEEIESMDLMASKRQGRNWIGL